MIKQQLESIKEITLLYVEDQEETREELVEFFKRKVKKLYVAKDGQEGLEKYKAHRPDLVLTDIQMPKLDGMSMGRLIKDINPKAEIIVLTAFTEEEYLLEAIKLGIHVYETKPIDIKELLCGMAKVLKTADIEKKAL